MLIGRTLLVLVLLYGGAVVLQVFLSRLEHPVPGLILPALSFLYSLVMVLNLVATDSMGGWDVFLRIASTLLLGNLFTAALVVIYFVCRAKSRRNKQIDKMNIHDLN